MSQSQFPDALKQLMDEFSRSDIRELHIRNGDFELYLSTEAGQGRHIPPAAPAAQYKPAKAPEAVVKTAAAPKAAPVTVTATADVPDDAIIITAPNLGTFYRAPKPGADNYVEVGAVIKAGDEICLIEVMKLFTALRATEAGRVHSVLVEDGAMVEAGQPLFALVKN